MSEFKTKTMNLEDIIESKFKKIQTIGTGNTFDKFVYNCELYAGTRDQKFEHMKQFSSFKGKPRAELTNAILLKIINENPHLPKKENNEPDLEKINKMSYLYLLSLNFSNDTISDITSSEDNISDKFSGLTTLESCDKTPSSIENSDERMKILFLLGKFISKDREREEELKISNYVVEELCNTLHEMESFGKKGSSENPHKTDSEKINHINKVFNTGISDDKKKPVDLRSEIFISYSYIVRFAWKLSNSNNFSKLFPQDDRKIIKKMGMDGGMFLPDEDLDDQEETVLSPREQQRRNRRNRYVIFIGLVIYIISLLTLFENLRRLYIVLHKLYTDYGQEIFQEENTFTIALFLRLMQQIGFGVFDLTLKSMHTYAASKIQRVSHSVYDTVQQEVQATWDYGISSWAIGLISGDTYQTASEVGNAEIEFQKQQEILLQQRNLSVLMSRTSGEIRTLYRSVLFGINGLCTSTLILLNQYDDNVVSNQAVVTSVGVLSATLGFKNVGGEYGIYPTMGQIMGVGAGIFRLITNSTDPTELPPQYLQNGNIYVEDAGLIAQRNFIRQQIVVNHQVYNVVSDDEEGDDTLGGKGKKRKTKKKAMRKVAKTNKKRKVLRKSRKRSNKKRMHKSRNKKMNK